MSNEKFLDLLRAALEMEDCSSVTDAELEDFMSTSAECTPETLVRMRARFVEKLLDDLHPEPVREIEVGLSFGKWLKRRRKNVLLTSDALAETVGKHPSFIQDLETDAVFPWEINAGDIADLIVLLRLHIDAVEQFRERARRSEERRRRRSVRDSRAQSRKPYDESAVPRSPASLTKENNSYDFDQWIDVLRRELQKRKATNLLE